MLYVLGNLLPYAVPVALSPLPVIAVVMLLIAPAGVRGGLCFGLGRALALAVLALLVGILATRLVPADGDPGGAGWLRIGFGCLVLLAAVVVWRGRPRGGKMPALPGWMRSIERKTPGGALWLGMLLTVVNVKELAFVIGAGMILGMAELPTGQVMLLSAIFAILACLGVLGPVLWMAVAAEASRAGLIAARDWLVRNNSIVLVVGTMLIGTGLEQI